MIGGVDVPYPISLLKLGREGKKNIKDGPKRLEAAKKLVQAARAKWVEIYATLGEYDFVAIMEITSPENAIMTTAAISSQGEVSSQTLVAFNEAEWKKIVAKLP